MLYVAETFWLSLTLSQSTDRQRGVKGNLYCCAFYFFALKTRQWRSLADRVLNLNIMIWILLFRAPQEVGVRPKATTWPHVLAGAAERSDYSYCIASKLFNRPSYFLTCRTWKYSCPVSTDGYRIIKFGAPWRNTVSGKLSYLSCTWFLQSRHSRAHFQPTIYMATSGLHRFPNVHKTAWRRSSGAAWAVLADYQLV